MGLWQDAPCGTVLYIEFIQTLPKKQAIKNQSGRGCCAHGRLLIAGCEVLTAMKQALAPNDHCKAMTDTRAPSDEL
jgi:hypothetical protein